MRRRAFLSAALVAPSAFLAAAHSDEAVDGAIAASAEEVRRLFRVAADASERRMAVEDAYDQAFAEEFGPRPELDTKRIANECISVLVAFGELTPEVDAAVAAKRAEIEARVLDATDRWDAAYSEHVARIKSDDTVNRGIASADAAHAAMSRLADMQAASLHGILAKASVFRSPNAFCADFFAHLALAHSILRDLGAEVEMPDEWS